MKILLINPAKSLLNALEDSLHFPKFSISTLHGKIGFENNIRIFHPDVVLMIEKNDNKTNLKKAIEFIRSKKAFDNTQIIFLGENLKDEKMIELYEKGVDFILSNTISPLIIIKYIQNIQSKFSRDKKKENKFISLNSNDYTVRVGDKNVTLVKREFELLQLLLTPPNKIYTRNEIIQHIWSDMSLKNDRTIDVHITRLRQKLNIENIVTVKRKGFKFVIQ